MQDNEIIAGNVFDKYNSTNPLVRLLMENFEADISGLIDKVKPAKIYEIGCGEGYWVLKLKGCGFEARGCDISPDIIEKARSNAAAKGFSPLLFQTGSIYDLKPDEHDADLTICTEVLEHLKQPERALESLQNVVNGHLILSVPWEPVWRMLNLARGRYIRSFGNTPGHIQHFSRRGIVQLVSRYFEVLEVRQPFPWTVVLCRPLPG